MGGGNPDHLNVLARVQGPRHSQPGDRGPAGHPVPALFEGQGDGDALGFGHRGIVPRWGFALGDHRPHRYDTKMDPWSSKRFLVTGGAGSVRGALCRTLAERGANDVVIARSRDYDLTHQSDVEKLFAEVAPDVVIHLAARVGGIGANLGHPAELYISNLLMGTYVIEEARAA